MLEESYATDDAARETAAIAWAENQRLRDELEELQNLLRESGIDYSSGK